MHAYSNHFYYETDAHYSNSNVELKFECTKKTLDYMSQCITKNTKNKKSTKKTFFLSLCAAAMKAVTAYNIKTKIIANNYCAKILMKIILKNIYIIIVIITFVCSIHCIFSLFTIECVRVCVCVCSHSFIFHIIILFCISFCIFHER